MLVLAQKGYFERAIDFVGLSYSKPSVVGARMV
jgi:hypothetical protein